MSAGVAHYTPQRVEQVYRNAIGGDFSAQWKMFVLMESTWPRLSKNLNELKDSVVSMRFSVLPWALERKKPTPDAVERAKFISELLWSMSPDPTSDENDFEDTVRDLLDARGKGISILEIDWCARQCSAGPAMAPRATRWVHPSTYGYPPKATDFRLKLKRGEGRNEYWEDFPNDKFIIGICKNKTGHTLNGAMLHALGFWWAASNFSTDWFLNFAQMFGQPIRWATYDPNMSPSEHAKLTNMLANMGNSAWGAFPAGTNLQLKEASQGFQSSPHLALIQMADKACDLLILHQMLTSDVGSGGGSLALGNVHERVLSGTTWACAKWVAKTLQQLVRSICILNFGDDRECPWLRPVIEKENLPAATAALLVSVSAAGLQPTDAAIPGISESVGFKVQRIKAAAPLPFPNSFLAAKMAAPRPARETARRIHATVRLERGRAADPYEFPRSIRVFRNSRQSQD